MAIEKFIGTFKNETQEGFTILITKVIQSINELDVLGLYIYLSSLPSTWKPNAKHLMNHTGYSKDKIYRLLNRLIELGLMTAQEKRDKGRFSTYEYIVHLYPTSPCPEKPDTVLPDTVNQDAYKINNIKNKEYTKGYINAREKTVFDSNSKEIQVQEKPGALANPDFEYQETLYPVEVKNELENQQTKAMYKVDDDHINDFERFWSLYPLQRSKSRVQAIWFSSGYHRIADTIIDKLRHQISSDKRFLDGFVMNPAKYLSEREWESKIYSGNSQKTHFDYKDTTWAAKRDIFD